MTSALTNGRAWLWVESSQPIASSRDRRVPPVLGSVAPCLPKESESSIRGYMREFLVPTFALLARLLAIR
jgi:hypothetical protein